MDITVDFSDSTDKHIKILDLGECLDEETLNLEDMKYMKFDMHEKLDIRR
jgi:hypothetical protein